MSERVFVRGLQGAKYNLKAARQARLASARVASERVRAWRDENAVGHEDASPTSRAKWMVGPGDEPFLTQSIQCHFVQLDAGGSNGGHGHQNEAAFYILQGRGYEIHDGKRYDWKAGDLVVVHNDSKHQHFNASATEQALAIVVKAKSLYLFLGLMQQGNGMTAPDGEEHRFGPRQDWGALWTPGVDAKRKVVDGESQPWEATPDGRIKWLANGATQSYAGTKRQLNRWLYEQMDAQLEFEAGIQREMSASGDFAEGIAAFAEKRPPRFSGA